MQTRNDLDFLYFGGLITIRIQPTAPNEIVFWMAFVVAPVIMKLIDILMRPRLCRSVGKKNH